jgi:hypothetical protein
MAVALLEFLALTPDAPSYACGLARVHVRSQECVLIARAPDSGVRTQWGSLRAAIVFHGLHGQTHTSTLQTIIALLPGGQLLFLNRQLINLSKIYGQQNIAGECVWGRVLH